MSKKVLYVITILVLISVYELKGQSEGVNIWDITSRFLIENGEKPSESAIYPEITNDGVMVMPCIIMSTEGYISSPDYLIPQTESLVVYSFGALVPHVPWDLLFVKNGLWHFVNMKKSLSEIMSQCVDLCNKLSLTDKESLCAFMEVLKMYESNDKNSGGTHISPEGGRQQYENRNARK